MLVLEEKLITAYDTGYFICGNDAFELDLPPIEKLLYIALIKYAGTNNRAWPTFERLARDVGCSTRKAKAAVAVLIETGLLVKKRRGNQSNLYHVYPPKHYQAVPKNNAGPRVRLADEESAIVHDVHHEENPNVHHVHFGSAPRALSSCTMCTTVVHDVHPNITKNINKNIPHQQGNREEEKSLTPGEEKTLTAEEEEKALTISEKDIEAVKKSFKAKKAQVKEAVIVSLLERYEREDVQAAIRCCDFDTAKNPIAVIRYMLREGNYISEAKSSQLYRPPLDEAPLDYEEAKRYLKEAREVIFS